MRAKTLLAAAALAAAPLAAAAGPTLDELVCAELEWHHAEAVDRWHRIAERPPSQPIEVDPIHVWIAPLRVVHGIDRAMEAHALEPVQARIAMLRQRASNRGCSWVS